MTATKPALAVIPPLGKMEERKRSLLPDADESVPSRKRQKDENGHVMRMADDKEKDVEDFQKDAIMRQMKEYKRQKKDAEESLAELRKKSAFHDDHLRIINAWFAQLLEELRVLASRTLPTPPPSAISPAGMTSDFHHVSGANAEQVLRKPTGEDLYASALLFETNDLFSAHLQTHSDGIKSAITDIFSRLPPASPEVEDLRRQRNELLAKEKVHTVELKTAIDEKESMLERLEQAMGRYMTAERKLDRAKSTQIQKLERAATMGGNAETTSPTARSTATPKAEHSETNGDLHIGNSAEAESARLEAIAAAEKQKAQVVEIEKENERLTNELSAARTRLASLSDEDYAESSLFKVLKSGHEDVLRRINDLQATNVHLREEAQRFQSERTSYRRQIDEETRNNTDESEAATARAEADVARIRQQRDLLESEYKVVLSKEDNTRVSVQQANELAEASRERIAALESQVTRLQLKVGEIEPEAINLDALDEDTIKARFRTLQNQHSLLNNELPSMETAWKKAQVLASKKIDETANWEEQVARSVAEKAKADQKYFASMRAKEAREAEVKALQKQNASSSRIVSELRDAEVKTREICGSLERQLADAKEGLARLEQQHRHSEQKLRDMNSSADGLKKSVEELKLIASAKDKENLGTAKAKRDAEEDLERTRARLEDTKRQFDAMKKSRAAINSADSDDWRKVAICPVCNANIRNTALKLCGHVFCSTCVRDLITNRSRKCPSCARAFGANDHMSIVLT